MTDPSCLFCKIGKGEIPATIVHDDALCFAFEDLRPQAPMHVLVVPRTHVATINELQGEHAPTIGHLFVVAAEIAKERGVAGTGYRCVFNCNAAAGQTVWHVHLHVLGGRSFAWPPG